MRRSRLRCVASTASPIRRPPLLPLGVQRDGCPASRSVRSPRSSSSPGSACRSRSTGPVVCSPARSSSPRPTSRRARRRRLIAPAFQNRRRPVQPKSRRLPSSRSRQSKSRPLRLPRSPWPAVLIVAPPRTWHGPPRRHLRRRLRPPQPWHHRRCSSRHGARHRLRQLTRVRSLLPGAWRNRKQSGLRVRSAWQARRLMKMKGLATSW